MCGPAAAMAALAVASTAYSIDQQNSQAAYQREQADKQNKATLDNYMTQQRLLNMQDAQETDQATLAKQQQQLQAQKAIATQRVAAGEAGISGLSVDSIFADVMRQAGGNISTINRNLSDSQAQRNEQRQALRYNSNAQFVNRNQFKGASMLGAGLQLASAAGSAYTAAGGKFGATDSLVGLDSPGFSGTQKAARIDNLSRPFS